MARKTVEERFWSKVEKTDTCWLWVGARNEKGYGLLGIGSTNQVRAHRWIYETTNQCVVPEGMFVCHRCDNPSCVRPEHLYVGTHTDNMLDRAQRDRAAKGEDSGPAKLTDDQVRAIRAAYIPGKVDCTALGKTYKVDHTTVKAIVTGETWKHIK
jgi:hypothetical protein